MRTPKIAAGLDDSGESSPVATTLVDERQSLAGLSTRARPKSLNLHFEWLVAGVILGAMVASQWLFVSCNGGVVVSEKQSALSRFEIVENEGDEFIACLQVGRMCASIERVDGLYVPTIAADEWGDPVGKGQGLRTPELAAESALSLMHGYLDGLQKAFAGFTPTNDMVEL